MFLKKIVFTYILIFTSNFGFSQIPGLTFTKENEQPDLYLKSKTIWMTGTPFFFVERKFSPDQGSTYLRVGMLGGKLKPYLQEDSIAMHELNNYKLTRILGMAQMGVIAPLLAYKHFNPGSQTSTGNETLDENIQREEQTGYLTAAIIVFFTGTLTYHVFSRGSLFHALERYNYILGNKVDLKNTTFKMNLTVDPISQTPQIAMVWTF